MLGSGYGGHWRRVAGGGGGGGKEGEIAGGGSRFWLRRGGEGNVVAVTRGLVLDVGGERGGDKRRIDLRFYHRGDGGGGKKESLLAPILTFKAKKKRVSG